jgi:hypothetical protein
VYLLATARAENDKHARQAQLLWSACQSLHRRLKASTPGVPWQQQLQPLRLEIENVSKAAGEFISSASCSHEWLHDIFMLICIDNFTFTIYVHQMLASLQHLSAHHRCHHLGVLSVAITGTLKWSVV